MRAQALRRKSWSTSERPTNPPRNAAAGSDSFSWSTWFASSVARSRPATGPKEARSCRYACHWQPSRSERHVMPDERVLVVVEDDASFSRTLKRSFERRGYTVFTAANHDELVALLKTHSPGYAVVDLKLA